MDDVVALMRRMNGDAKHLAAATSTLHVLWTMYDRVLAVSPDMADTRDRFFLSKGHGPMAYYAVLAAKGFLEPLELYRFGSFDSPLGHHPDRMRIPGVEISSGSLGHGLPLAVGTALGLRIRGLNASKVWVLVGDGELDEGSNAEAIAFAGRRALDNLHVIVIDNGSASLGWPGGIAARFAVEEWSTATVAVDPGGESSDELEKACIAEHASRPHVVVARVPPGVTP